MRNGVSLETTTEWRVFVFTMLTKDESLTLFIHPPAVGYFRVEGTNIFIFIALQLVRGLVATFVMLGAQVLLTMTKHSMRSSEITVELSPFVNWSRMELLLSIH